MHADDRSATPRLAMMFAARRRRGAALRSPRLAALALCTVDLFIAAGSASAANRVWVGAFGDGDGVTYASPLNWSPSGVPGALDSAIFNFVPASVIMPGGFVVNDRLILTDGGVAVSLDIQGGLFRLNNAASSGLGRSLVVGGSEKSDVSLVLSNGSMVAKHAVLGAEAGSVGVMHIDSDASLQTTGTLIVGEAGTGHIDNFGELITGPIVMGVEAVGDGKVGTAVESTSPSSLLLALGDVSSGNNFVEFNFTKGALGVVLGDLSLSTGVQGQTSCVTDGLGSSLIVDGDASVGGTATEPGGYALMQTNGPNALVRIGGTLRTWPGGQVNVQDETRVDAGALELRGGQMTVGPSDAALVVGSPNADAGAGLFAGLEASTDTTTIDVLEGGEVAANFASLGSAAGSRTKTTIAGKSSLLNVEGDLDLGWAPLPPEAGQPHSDATLLVRDAAQAVVGGQLRIQQGGWLRVDGGDVSVGSLDVTDFGRVAGVLHGNEPTTLVAVDGLSTLGGGLFIEQSDPQTLPNLGVEYTAVQGSEIAGNFAVIFTRPLPAFRYYKATNTTGGGKSDRSGKGGGGSVTLTVDKLESLLGLTELVPVQLEGSPNEIVAGAFDGDALPDAFVTIPGKGKGDPGTGSLLMNTGAADGVAGGGFALVDSIGLGTDPSGLDSADFTGDGIGDFVVSNAGDGTLQIILNNTAGLVGGLSQGQILSVGGRPRGVRAADLDGDGKPDLVWVDPTSNTVNTATEDGKGGFNEPEAASAGPQPSSVDPIDLDNDKDIDLTVVNSGGAATFGIPYSGSTVTIHLNTLRQSGYGFEKAISYAVGDGAIALTSSDLNHDGYPDIITANSIAGTISVLIGKPGGTFFPAVDLPAGGFPKAIAAGDFDNDTAKDEDIAVLITKADGTQGITIFRNDSFGGQTVLTIIENAQDLIGLPEAITSANTDGDGPNDLVFVGSFNEGGGGNGYVSVIQSVPILCPADTDGNGVVDGNDLGAILSNYGPAPDGSFYDINKDGVVDGVDLSILLSSWGPCDLGND
ncbi:MAG: FG-GAP-like repeat-containing protein [Phycisphaerales bacterium]